MASTTPLAAAPSTTTTSQPPLALSLSATSWTVGDPVTVSGAGCASGWAGNVGVSQPAQGDPQATYPGFVSLTPHPVLAGTGATWSITEPVPAVVIGPATVSATCEDPSTGTVEATYESLPVTIATPYRISVIPEGAVAPGTQLTVSSTAGGCGSLYAPVVDLWSSSSSSLPGPNAVYGEVGGSANWTLTLTVPPGTTPDTYYVTARCELSRGHDLTYQPAPVTVTG